MEGYRTLIGLLVALIAEALRSVGVDIGDREGVINSVLVLLGIVVAIYGRFKARGPVGGGAWNEREGKG